MAGIVCKFINKITSAYRWRQSTQIGKKDFSSTFWFTTVQKDALLSVIKALDIDVTERVLSEEEEDIALMVAMEEGLKSGIATEQERNDFESFLSGNSLSSMSIPRHLLKM